jgi:zinc transport system substrate-binding protein
VLISEKFFSGGKMFRAISLILVALSFFLSSCTSKQPDLNKTGVIKVTVSILPQKFIVEKIGKERVKVNVMVPPAASPETYEPSPQKIMELKDSAIYFLIGMAFEKDAFLKIKDEYKNVVFSPMYEGINLRDPDHGSHHDHGNDHPFKPDGEKDPHIWLDPVNLMKMAENTVSELMRIDQAHRVSYVQNLYLFKKEVQILHDELVDLFKESSGKGFMIYHPAWGYFADRFGLKQIPVEVEGKEPTAVKMAELTDHMNKNKAKYIFLQPQSSAETVKSFSSQTGVQIRFMDPLKENVLENIKDSAIMIKEGLVSAKHN